MADDHRDLPFKGEYAKSGRSACNECKNAIGKDSLRLAVMVQSTVFDGKIPNWYHYECFWENAQVEDAHHIHGFDSLRWDDQKKLKEKIEEVKASKVDEEEKPSKKITEDRHFVAQYAASNRSTCRGCNIKIDKNALRIAREYYYDSDSDHDDWAPTSHWHHVDCFVKQRESLEYSKEMNIENISGFKYLQAKDQKELISKVGKGGKPAKKRGTDSKDDGDAKKAKTEETEEEKQLQEQSQLLWEYRDQLKKHVSNDQMKIMLESNGQELPSGESRLLDACSDNMVFGTLQKCPECKKGQLVFSSVGYKCTGSVTEWTKCMYITKKPGRKAFKIPLKCRDATFLKKYKYVKRDRVFSTAAASVSSSLVDDSMDTTDSAGKSRIKSFGRGQIKDDEEHLYTNVPTKLKMNIKSGVAVDPDSGMAETAHVVEDGKDCLYNVVLGQVDVVRGTNSYYKIQALESDSTDCWWIFRSWGRVGTTIGGKKSEECGSRDSVIDNFKQLYGEKTGNSWEDRKDFKKQTNKFYPLEIEYGEEDEDTVKKLTMAGSQSKLPKPVQNLICKIFDVESMKKAMMEFEIDLKKMPLGKLSKRQIESAYKILTELTNLMEKGGTQTQFLDATNRFYTLVPHDFGLKKPPILDSAEVIKGKTEMLDNLLEIEVAYNMLKSADAGEDPVDSNYKKLKTDMQPMDKSSKEYKRLVEYVKNTHAATHNQYELEVQEIFKIERDGERKRYTPFKKLPNKQLLWHGSRITNFAGILSQGLRIAPPEAPVTGYMFGKGVYFADMVSKSANYCRTSKSEPIGLLMLCEVALGNMYERFGADYIATLPKGKHSTKGCGRTAPDPTGIYTTKDGVTIPMGKGMDAKIDKSSLLYNEYIVYDVAQINMKYLLQTNFKYKW